MRIAFWVVLGAGVLAAVLIAWMKLALRVVRREMEAAFSERFEPGEVLRSELDANFFGQSSAGLAQIRGNGGLALTRDRLWFLQFAPRRELEVPFAAVRSVGTRTSHLGKACLLPLLYVEFDNQGEPDAAAWAVRDAEAWARAVEEARRPFA